MVKKRIVALLLAPFVAVLSLIILIYVLWPWVVRFAVETTLNSSGIELLEMNVNHLSLENITAKTIPLKHLSLKLKDKTEVSINDVKVGFNDTSISLDRIDIALIDIQLNSTDKLNLKEPNKVDLSTWLPSQFMKYVPTSTVLVQTLKLNTPSIELNSISFDLSSDGITTQTQVSASADENEFPVLSQLEQVNLSLTISGDNRINVHLIDSNSNKWIKAELAITTKGNNLQGYLTVKGAFEKLTLPLDTVNELTVKNAHLTSLTDFSLPTSQLLTSAGITQLMFSSDLNVKADMVKGQLLDNVVYLVSELRLKSSLDKGRWHLAVQKSKGPALQAKGLLENIIYTNLKSKSGINKKATSGVLIATVNKPIIFSGELVNDVENIQGSWPSISDGDLLVNYEENNKQRVELHFSAPSLVSDKSGESTMAMHIQGKILVDNTAIRFPSVKGVFETIDANINLFAEIKNNLLRIKTTDKNQLKLNNVQFNDYAAKSLSLEFPKQMFSANLETMDVSSFLFWLRGYQLNSKDLSVDHFEVKSIARSNEKKITIDSTTKQVKPILSGELYTLPPLKVKTKLSLDELSVKQASVELFNSCQQPISTLNWQPINNTLQQVDVRWQQTFSEGKTLRKWLNSPDVPIDFTEGEFRGHLIVDLKEQGASLRDAKVSLKDIHGIHKLGSFDGVQLRLSTSSRQLKTNKGKERTNINSLSVKLDGTIDQINMGTELDNIAFKSTVFEGNNGWQATIPIAKANIFSGAVELRDETINFNEDIKLDMLIKEIDLSQLIETQQVDGLHTTGRLSGHVPVSYINEQLEVLEGELHNTRHGEIRYSSPLNERDDLNEQLKMTLNVLENFNYSSLNSKITYDDGALVFNSSIVGKNPDVAQGQTVNLNLNTEVGLKGAIEAMRVQSGIDSRVEAFITSKVDPKSKQYYCQ